MYGPTHTLLYRKDIEQVRNRLATWWNGGDIGRPVMLLTAPRAEPMEAVAPMPEPEGWLTSYSTRDFAYRVNLSARACIRTHYLGEAVPTVAPDLGPNCLALYLGCRGVDGLGTVWFEPCIRRPEEARFAFDATNFYWDFTLRLTREQLRIGQGKFLVSFPDLIEGLDTLAAMRGTQRLLVDLIERPSWVHDALTEIAERYFDYYDVLYDTIRDEWGGSRFWVWAPGRMAKFQCDFSAMISPGMFREFMVPVLMEMSQRVDYCIYHWDGPGAIPHHDHLLAIPGIHVLQWTPGAGAKGPADREWWPLYHKTIEAGKKVMIGLERTDELAALHHEFGPKLKSFVVTLRLETPEQAREIIESVGE